MEEETTSETKNTTMGKRRTSVIISRGERIIAFLTEFLEDGGTKEEKEEENKNNDDKKNGVTRGH